MKQKTKCVNLHTHTNRSDGVMSPEDLIKAAIKNHNGVLSITDHNEFTWEKEFRVLEEKYKNQIKLVRGIESSVIYETSQKEDKEIHVIFLTENSEKIKFLGERKMDREGYITAIRNALLKCGIKIPTYEELLNEYPETSHLGRKHIADWMYRHQLTNSVDEGFDIYIGGFGEKRAFVDSAPYRKEYRSLQDTIKEVREAAGDSLIAIILCHPFYYRFDNEAELLRLCKIFKECAGPFAGIENIYHRYNEEERAYLTKIADEFGFLYSGATDFHGQSETDSLYIDAPMEIWEGIEKNWKKQIKNQED